MNTTTLRPHPVLGAVEAMRLRDTIDRVLEDGSRSINLDMTGVRELSAAGLAAVTNLLAQGRRTGFAVRLLLPEDPEATEVIEQADLGRFLAPGGIWNRSSSRHTGPMEPHTAVALVA